METTEKEQKEETNKTWQDLIQPTLINKDGKKLGKIMIVGVFDDEDKRTEDFRKLWTSPISQ